jgi:hypothetical protein
MAEMRPSGPSLARSCESWPRNGPGAIDAALDVVYQAAVRAACLGDRVGKPLKSADL